MNSRIGHFRIPRVLWRDCVDDLVDQEAIWRSSAMVEAVRAARLRAILTEVEKSTEGQNQHDH